MTIIFARKIFTVMYVANDDPHFAPSPQILEKFATLLWSGKDEIIKVFFIKKVQAGIRHCAEEWGTQGTS